MNHFYDFLAISFIKNRESLRLSPIIKLITQLATALWILSEDTKTSEPKTKESLVLGAMTVARVSAFVPHITQDDTRRIS